jgi:hypothetical protein
MKLCDKCTQSNSATQRFTSNGLSKAYGGREVCEMLYSITVVRKSLVADRPSLAFQGSPETAKALPPSRALFLARSRDYPRDYYYYYSRDYYCHSLVIIIIIATHW